MRRTVMDIYKQYHIPAQLQLHMLRVAAVGCKLIDHWRGPAIHNSRLIRVLLVHDIGNLVKIDLGDPSSYAEPLEGTDPPLLVLHAFQHELRKRFGVDDQLASMVIAREIGLSLDEITLLDGKVFSKNDETARSNDYDRKIGAYADQRVAPYGVVSLAERFKDLEARYHSRPGSAINSPRAPVWIQFAYTIERQILSECELSASDINDESIHPYLEGLRRFLF